MRILQINVVYRFGSTGNMVYNLEQEYKKHGHVTASCYGRGRHAPCGERYRVATALEVYSHVLYTRVTGYTGNYNLLATKRLLAYIRSFKPDIVHLHNLHGYYLHIYRLCKYLRDSHIPVVITMHDELLLTGKCGHPFACEKWMTRCHACPQLHTYPKSLWFDRSGSEFDKKRELFSNWPRLRIVPVAQWMQKKAEHSPILGKLPMRVIYNGLDSSVFSPAEDPARKARYGLQGKKVLLHVTPSFADPQKGGNYVLQLAGMLQGLPVAIVIVGAQTAALSMPANVIAISHTDNQKELASLYTMADCLLLTSQMESMPTVCLESLCCGTPVIGFFCGGGEESAPEPYGKFVSYGDTQGLGRLAERLVDGSLHMASPAACAAFGRANYSNEHMAGQYMELYKELL